MKKILLTSCAILALSYVAANAQAFSGPAIIQQPTTAGHCLTITSTGSNKIQDSGSACGSGMVPAVVSGDVVTGNGTGIQDSGLLLTSFAPLANPNFTGTVTAVTMTGTGVLTNSLNPTTSQSAINITGTPQTSGTAITNFPLVNLNCLGSTAPSDFSANGTFFGVNSCSGFNGNIIDIHNNGGVSAFSINSNGGLISASSGTFGSLGVSAGNFNVTSSIKPPVGIYLATTNSIGFSTNTILRAALNTTAFASNTAGSFSLNFAASTATVPAFAPNNSDLTTGIGAQASGNVSFIVGGAEFGRVSSGGWTFGTSNLSAIADLVANSATSYRIINTTPTATVPDLITNRGDITTGVGGASGHSVLIAGGVNQIDCVVTGCTHALAATFSAGLTSASNLSFSLASANVNWSGRGNIKMAGDGQFQISTSGGTVATLTPTAAGTLNVGVTGDATGTINTGLMTLGAAGAASSSPLLMSGTIYAAGTGTTNFPAFFMQPAGTTAVTTWSTAGTSIGANLPNGFTGNFLDFHIAGSSTGAFTAGQGGLNYYVGSSKKFQVDSSGNVYIAGVYGALNNNVVLQLGSSGDVGLSRGGAAGILSAGNGTAADVSGTVAATNFSSYNLGSPGATNHEELNINWTANQVHIQTAAGGTGTNRDIIIGTSASLGQLLMPYTSTGAGGGSFKFSNGGSFSDSAAASVNILGTWGQSSTSSHGPAALLLSSTINQTSTAKMDMIQIAPTVTAKGSGGLNLLHGLAGAAGTTEVFSENDAGDFKTIGALISSGTTPTLTGTCTTASQTGGNTAGTFTATCVSQTVIITFATTAPNGWSCNAHDQTTPADVLSQSANSTTSCTLSGTTVALDRVVFDARAY